MALTSSERARLWREKNPEKVVANNKKFNALHRLDRRLALEALKSDPCADCGGTFPPECMDFDHISGQKIEGVSHVMRDSGIKAGIQESEKCELVCANCHRIRTRKRAVRWQN